MSLALLLLLACRSDDAAPTKVGPPGGTSTPAGGGTLDTGAPDVLVGEVTLEQSVDYDSGVGTGGWTSWFALGPPFGPIPTGDPCVASSWSMTSYDDDPAPHLVSAGDVSALVDGIAATNGMDWPAGAELTARATGGEFPAFDLTEGVTVPTTTALLPARVDIGSDLVLHLPPPHADYVVVYFGTLFGPDDGESVQCILPDADEVIVPKSAFDSVGQPLYGGLQRVSVRDVDVGGGATLRLSAVALEAYADWFQ
jgi:hypothetical protein